MEMFVYYELDPEIIFLNKIFSFENFSTCWPNQDSDFSKFLGAGFYRVDPDPNPRIPTPQHL